jgi:L-ribulose-5-phosphate 4-epimerase
MRIEKLKKIVWEANLRLYNSGLVILTWGNVSGFHREEGLVAIKPSGVAYEKLKPEDIVLVDLEGNIVGGYLNPSSDTPIHLELYRAFPRIAGIAHTHSPFATAFAQAEKEIPCLGTTHADAFRTAVPVTRPLSSEEVTRNYEQNTGKSIVERFNQLDPLLTPGVLVARHGPFTWGLSPGEAVTNSLILEKVAEMAWRTLCLQQDCSPLHEYLIDKHHRRMHGPGAYYGQRRRRPDE